MGRDLLFRGRGADIGVRAPGWLVRGCGATLALGAAWLADALGIWRAVGFATWKVNLGALIGGAVLAPTALGVGLWLAAGGMALLLLLVMFTPIVRPMVTPFIRSDAVGTEPAQAVLVLSGGLMSDGRIREQALDRLLSAMLVVQRRGIPELVLSVVALDERQPAVTSEADQRALVQLGLPGITPRFVYDVHSTRDEALAFAALARTHGWRRVVVVTSPMHSRRACAAIAHEGLMVECRPADGRDYSVRDLDADHDRRLAFQDVVYETTATWLYRARGWM
jgi:uncharacterized SAM-binding protein YcdF (DUF218 family)